MNTSRLVTRKTALRILALSGIGLMLGGCESFLQEAMNKSRHDRWDEEDRRTHGEGGGLNDGKGEK